MTELLQLDELRLAHKRCEMLENDVKLGLWSLLDSRTRRALKKVARLDKKTNMVGSTRFELVTSWMSTKRSNQLS